MPFDVIFFIFSSYYTLMIWFPELFYRFEEYEQLHPGETASVCDVSQVVAMPNSTLVDPFCSNEPIKTEVFLHTLIIGLACIPTSFWLPLCVRRLGTKFFLGKSSFIIRHTNVIEHECITL